MAKRDFDWEGIEQNYRAGIKTLRQIAEEFGVSHVAITKRAKRDDWVRDLSAKIAAAVEEKVTKAEVTKKVTKEQRVTEQAIVEVNAQSIADKVLEQRSDIKRARSIVQKLWEMVEAELDNAEDFRELGEIMARPDDNGNDKLNDMYHAAIGLPQQIKNAKLLADALKVLIELERKVLRIKDDPEPTATVVLKADPNLSPAEAYLRMLGKK